MPQALTRAAQWLPRGGSLEAARWRRHHGLVTLLLAVHLPLLGAFGLVASPGSGGVLVALLALVAALLGAGLALPTRVLRSLAVTLGLLLCSAAFLLLTGGAAGAAIHYLVVLGFVALYHDWRPYLLAVVFVVGMHGVAAPALVAGPAGSWTRALLHGGFVLVVAVSHLLLWRTTEAEHDEANRCLRRLYEGERAVVGRLREAEELKDQLLAVTSHELRTPLTAIIGLTKTLSAHAERLDSATVAGCLEDLERQAEGLSKLVDNLVVASEVAAPTGSATDLDRVAMDLGAAAAQAPADDACAVHVDVPARLTAAIGPDAARQVVGNLLDNAVKFRDPGTDVYVTGRRTGDDVVMEVANAAAPAPLGDAIFAPFVQGDSSDSRPVGGLGLGLHVVRRLVEAHGGSVEVDTGGREVRARVRLPAPCPPYVVDQPRSVTAAT